MRASQSNLEETEGSIEDTTMSGVVKNLSDHEVRSEQISHYFYFVNHNTTAQLCVITRLNEVRHQVIIHREGCLACAFQNAFKLQQYIVLC